MTPQEIQEFRASTRGCRNVAHFNNAGAALMPDSVYHAVTTYLERECYIGGYEAFNENPSAFDAFYSGIAELIGAKAHEIAYIENATRAWDMAFYSIPFKAGDVIITAQAEYVSNYLAFLQVARRTGAVIKVVPDDAHGQLDVGALERMIDGKTKLIAITHVPTQGGLINPAEAVGKIAKAHGVLYLLDACQSVGQMPVDVDLIGCDMLSATGRKFLRGPRGTGFLYVRSSILETLDPIFTDLHAATWTADNSFTLSPGARRFENWECYYAGKLGLSEAVRLANSIGLSRIEARIQKLATLLRTTLAACPGVEVCDKGEFKSGIVTFQKAGLDPAAIQKHLLTHGVNVSVTQSSSSRLDLPKRGLEALVRASVHYYNTEEEVEKLTDLVRALPRS
jgi:selenocysteine lyase/cysteine desulfurase